MQQFCLFKVLWDVLTLFFEIWPFLWQYKAQHTTHFTGCYFWFVHPVSLNSWHMAKDSSPLPPSEGFFFAYLQQVHCDWFANQLIIPHTENIYVWKYGVFCMPANIFFMYCIFYLRDKVFIVHQNSNKVLKITVIWDVMLCILTDGSDVEEPVTYIFRTGKATPTLNLSHVSLNTDTYLPNCHIPEGSNIYNYCHENLSLT